MLCCTSAPPTTLMELLRANTGHVVGATKQILGLRRGAGSSSSGCAREGVRTDISFIDSFEVLRGLLDAGIGAHPAVLLGGDRLAVELGVHDRLRDERGVALADHLLLARQDA